MLVSVLPWLEYQWWFDYPVGMFAAIRERLRGTPTRLEELLSDVLRERLTVASDGKWSALGHAGHLVHAEQLWQTRLHQYLAGATTLTAAAGAKGASQREAPEAWSLPQILSSFRVARAETVALLDSLSLEQAALTAHHPRLGRPMRLVDLCLFAADHDDHHLAVVHALTT